MNDREEMEGRKEGLGLEGPDWENNRKGSVS